MVVSIDINGRLRPTTRQNYRCQYDVIINKHTHRFSLDVICYTIFIILYDTSNGTLAL